MRFSSLGAFIQTDMGSEGDYLWRAGMLDKIWEGGWAVGFEPSKLLQSLFRPMPPLEDAYPLLVEFTLYYRYRRVTGFVTDAQHAATCDRLRELGMTQDGVTTLAERLVRAIGTRATVEAAG
jgi:hypothetical protein